MKRAVLGLVFAVGALVIAGYALRSFDPAKNLNGGGSSAVAATTNNNITIDNFSFSPETLTIPAGTKVTWTNKDDIPHTVVESGHKFKSSALDTDDSFSYTFDQPGTYEYFCSLHPKMTARIVVEAAK